MPSLPSLELVASEVAAELTAQERRGDALDSKAGILLGFAGVIVGLAGQRLSGPVSDAGIAVGALAAIAAGAAFLPRSFPALDPARLRESYLRADVEFTRLRLLDTQVAMHGYTQRLLGRKAKLVTAAALLLGLAVILTVAGAILG